MRPWLGPISLTMRAQKILVLAVDRSHQRAASPRDQRARLALVAIGHDRRGRAEHLDLVHGAVRCRHPSPAARSARRTPICPRRCRRARAPPPRRKRSMPPPRAGGCPRTPPPAGARVTSGPMRVSSSRGSPTLVPLSFAASASAIASAASAGTKMRRIAVHFCPAFTVISRTTSRMKASKAAPPGAAPGASSAALMLSASMLTGTLLATTLAWPRTRARGVGGAGERDHVIGGERVEQIAGAAAEQAQRALRQHLGRDHVAAPWHAPAARSRKRAWRAPACRRGALRPPSPTAPSSGN